MNAEDHISFEVAKLLKEKGFSKRSYGAYNLQGEFQEGYGKWNKTPIYYAAPTLQMACKWLREMHHIVIGINIGNENNKGNTDYSNPDRWWYFWEWTNNKGVYKEELQPNALDNEYPTYEAACEAAIKYCLENLV